MKPNPRVGIVMGSQSDQSIVAEAAKVLHSFNIPFETHIYSAHRTPAQVHEWVKKMDNLGVGVFIAAAGKSAHLPGVVASLTVKPVIGIPIETSDLGGLDSLLSIVQMPPGIPVATVAIGKAGAKNAGLLAVQILATSDPQLQEKLQTHREKMREEVLSADAKLQSNPEWFLQSL